MRSNCLIFALRKFRKEGGYFVIRRARRGWLWHCLWVPSLQGVAVEQYVPTHPIEWQYLPWWLRFAPVHMLLFRGFVKTNDE